MGYSAIGLHCPKNSLNVGAVLRAAACYGVSLVATTGRRYSPASTDTSTAYKNLPLLTCEDLRGIIPYDCVPVAVDLVEGAQSLVEYKHPERAFYIFGPEDGTLGQKVTSYCRDVVYIPTRSCMNLAATVNVVLYDRLAKRGNQ